MTSVIDAIDEIESELARHLAFLREGARTPARWPDVQRHYGLPVEPSPFGAVPPAKVHQVAQAIALGMARRLEAASAGADLARISALWARLGTLAAEEANAHAEATKPKSSLGLGGIFANATASVGKEWWAELKYDNKLMLLCRNCGAAQERTRDFKCAYCGGDFFGGAKDER